MAHLYSPYDNPQAVDSPGGLYGRHGVITQLIEGIFRSVAPQSHQIIGPTRIGKTSLFNVLRLCADNPHSQFVHELQLPEMILDRLHKTIFVQINYQRLPDREIPAFWQLMGEELAKACADQNPRCQSFSDFDTYLGGLIDRMELQLTSAYKLHIPFIFLMDEFDHVITKLPIDILNNHLRSLLEKYSGSLVYITATRKPLHEYYAEIPVLQDLHVSPLYNYFADEFVYPGLLEEAGTRKFIVEAAFNHGVSFLDEDILFARSLGGRHPDLTRIVCNYLFYERRDNPSGKLDYASIQNKVITVFEPTINPLLSGLSEIQKQVLASVIFRNKSGLNGKNAALLTSRTTDTLINLGLVVRTNKDVAAFSPVFEILFKEATQSLTEPELILSDEFRVWPEHRAIQINDKLQMLTPNEWKLFFYFREHNGQTCTREELLAGPFLGESEDALNITVSRLRQKLEVDQDKPHFIQTIRGQGWRFEE